MSRLRHRYQPVQAPEKGHRQLVRAYPVEASTTVAVERRDVDRLRMSSHVQRNEARERLVKMDDVEGFVPQQLLDAGA